MYTRHQVTGLGYLLLKRYTMPMERRTEGVMEPPELIPTYSTCGRRANLLLRPMSLDEWCQPVSLAVIESRTDHIRFTGKTLRDMAAISADFTHNTEPIVGIEGDRAAGAVHPDGKALEDIKRRVSHCEVNFGSFLRLSRHCPNAMATLRTVAAKPFHMTQRRIRCSRNRNVK